VYRRGKGEAPSSKGLEGRDEDLSQQKTTLIIKYNRRTAARNTILRKVRGKKGRKQGAIGGKTPYKCVHTRVLFSWGRKRGGAVY